VQARNQTSHIATTHRKSLRFRFPCMATCSPRSRISRQRGSRRRSTVSQDGKGDGVVCAHTLPGSHDEEEVASADIHAPWVRKVARTGRIKTYLEPKLGAEVLEFRQRLLALGKADLQTTQRETEGHVHGRCSKSMRSTQDSFPIVHFASSFSVSPIRSSKTHRPVSADGLTSVPQVMVLSHSRCLSVSLCDSPKISLFAMRHH